MKKILLMMLIILPALLFACQPAAPGKSAEETAAEPVLVTQEPTATLAVPETTTPVDEAQKSITVVTGLGGLGDETFNDIAWDGAQRAAKDFNLQASVIEPKSMAEITSIHLENAKSNKFLAMVGVGYEHLDGITAAASEYPDQKFIIIDQALEAPNVASFVFRHPDSAFVMGTIAAMMTQRTEIKNINPEKIVGLIVGVDYPTIHAFYTGMTAGAKWVDPEVQVLFGEVGAWNDPSKGNEIALSQYNQGADIIWHAAGGSGLGLFEAAKTADLYAMGCDIDQSVLDPDHIVCSRLLRHDVMIYQSIQGIVEGNFEPGVHNVGLKEGALDITCSGATNVTVPDDIILKAKEAKELIINGEIVVPTTDEELEAFLVSIGSQ